MATRIVKQPRPNRNSKMRTLGFSKSGQSSGFLTSSNQTVKPDRHETHLNRFWIKDKPRIAFRHVSDAPYREKVSEQYLCEIECIQCGNVFTYSAPAFTENEFLESAYSRYQETLTDGCSKCGIDKAPIPKLDSIHYCFVCNKEPVPIRDAKCERCTLAISRAKDIRSGNATAYEMPSKFRWINDVLSSNDGEEPFRMSERLIMALTYMGVQSAHLIEEKTLLDNYYPDAFIAWQ